MDTPLGQIGYRAAQDAATPPLSITNVHVQFRAVTRPDGQPLPTLHHI
jgi:hypothetical protein